MKKNLFLFPFFFLLFTFLTTFSSIAQLTPSHIGFMVNTWDLVAADKQVNLFITNSKDGNNYWWTYIKIENKSDTISNFEVYIEYDAYKKVGNDYKRTPYTYKVSYSLSPKSIILDNLNYLSLAHRAIIKKSRILRN